jgi:hypothetical protein
VTIWILALFVLVMFGSAGQMGGGIRLSIQLVGVIIAFALASPLSFILKPLIPLVGYKNPVTIWALPPILMFVLLNLIFASIAFGVHHKIEVHYTYRVADDIRMNWERVNSRLGICVGILMGAIYVVILGVLIFTAGYFTTQVSNGKDDPLGFRMLNTLTADMKRTGLDRVSLAVSPVGETFYLTSDIVGLMYQTPDLRKRLADYPLFSTLMDREDFKALSGEENTNYLHMISAKTNFMRLLRDETTQQLMKTKDLQALYHDMDLKDILSFARSGQSPKYEKEKLLGTWQMDLVPTVQAIRKKRNPPLPELKYITARFRVMLKDITLVTSADNKVSLRGSVADAQAIPQMLGFRLPPNMDMSRVSTNFFNTNKYRTVLTGTWKSGSSDTYTISLGDLGEGEATVKDDKMTLTIGNQPMVMGKVD